MSDEEGDDLLQEDDENADHVDLEAPVVYDDDEPAAEEAFVPEHLRAEKFDDEENDDHIKQLEEAMAKAKPKYEDMVPDADAFENALFGMEYMEENLGENFEETPWLPPTVERACEFRGAQVYLKGEEPMRKAKVTRAVDLGAAVPLYFIFVKCFMWCFFVMFLLSAPALALSYFGSRTPLEDKDGLGLYQFSIGNIGYNPDSPTFANDSKCEGAGYASLAGGFIGAGNLTAALQSSNATCVHLLGQELTMEEVTVALTVLECLQIAVFMIAVIYLHSVAQTYRAENEGKVISISDYSIIVQNIPPDTTAEQLIGHFSRLYPLDRPDWRRRPPVAGAEPVAHSDNSGDPMHIGTWVAECNVHKKIGVFLQAFREKQHLMEKLYRYRAQMKMYDPDSTPLAGGGNAKKYAAAEMKMCEVGGMLDLFSEQLLKKSGMKVKGGKSGKVHPGSGRSSSASGIELLDDSSGGDFDNSMGDNSGSAKRGRRKGGGGSADYGDNSGYIKQQGSPGKPQNAAADHALRADAVAAFVVFEYTESFARCVEDYEKYQHFPYSWCYPDNLKFRGCRIKVKKAPEPDEIVWENLEVPKWKKLLLRGRTNLVTFLLVLLCFVIILQAAVYKQKFTDNLPDLSLCEKEIPALYLDSFVDAENNKKKSGLARPEDPNERINKDIACDDIVPSSFYAKFSLTSDYNVPVGNYSMDECTDIGNTPTLCPIPSKTNPLCPCIIATKSSSHPDPCESLQCFKDAAAPSPYNDDTIVGEKCVEFDASIMGGCYCQAELLSILSSGSIMDSISEVRDAAEATGSACGDFFINYSLASGLTYMAILVSVVINYLLRVALKRLTDTECHLSVDEEQGSLMIKIFVAIYINIALVVIVAFGRVASLPTSLEPTQILMGSYDDFTIQWYATIGSLFIGSMILQSFSPLMGPLYDYFVSKPFQRYCYYASVQAQKSTRYAMQHELNMVEVGPVFQSSIQTATLLALLFFGMTYAAGLPLMMFLLWITFGIYFYFDRMLLCRYYQRPPRIGDAVIKKVCQYLPYAAILRLAVGAWMFTAPGVLKNITFQVSPTEPPPMFASIADRLSVSSALPLVAILIIIIVIKIIRFFWKQLPFYWAHQLIVYIYRTHRKKNKVYADENGYIQPFALQMQGDSLRQEVAPYTGDYYKIIEDKDNPLPKHWRTSVLIPYCCRKDSDYFTDEEIRQGWAEFDHPTEPERFVIRAMTWAKLVTLAGSVRPEGSFKRTYEVINALNGLSSYSLDRVPAYKMTMMGIKEGTSAIMEAQAQKRAGRHKAASIVDLMTTVGAARSVLKKYSKKKKQIKQKKLEASNWGVNPEELGVSLSGKVKKKKKKTSAQKNDEMDMENMYGAGGDASSRNPNWALDVMKGKGLDSDDDDSSDESSDDDYNFGVGGGRGGGSGDDGSYNSDSESDSNRLI